MIVVPWRPPSPRQLGLLGIDSKSLRSLPSLPIWAVPLHPFSSCAFFCIYFYTVYISPSSLLPPPSSAVHPLFLLPISYTPPYIPSYTNYTTTQECPLHSTPSCGEKDTKKKPCPGHSMCAACTTSVFPILSSRVLSLVGFLTASLPFPC